MKTGRRNQTIFDIICISSTKHRVSENCGAKRWLEIFLLRRWANNFCQSEDGYIRKSPVGKKSQCV